MADGTLLPDTARGPRGRYYDPPTTVKAVDGVSVRKTDRTDEYSGAAEAFVAMGLLTHDQFPGLPGMPTTSVSYRPRGGKGHCWHQPGYMTVFRKPDGTFRVVLRVRAQEIARRECARAAKEAARSARWTLDNITNRRVEPSGLVVESYPPRLTTYTGTKAQIVGAGVLPRRHEFPKPKPGKSTAWERWEEGDIRYDLAKKYVSARAHKLEDATADYWQLSVFDNCFTFVDHLHARAAPG